MFLSDVSVKRPVVATVLNLLLVIFGVVAFLALPLREYPNIEPPVVSISTNYPGANAEIMEREVTQRIERGISGIDGIRFISSSSRNGSSRVTIEFEAGRDIDVAANDVRERVQRITRRLPDQIDPPEISKAGADEDTVVWYNLRSEVMTSEQLTDYARRFMMERLAIVDGVATVNFGGERRYAMKLWLDRGAMAARDVTVTDIENRLRAENVELPAGSLESLDREFDVRVSRSYLSPSDFENLTIRSGDSGYLVRLGEVARVSLEAVDDQSIYRSNGVNMLGIGIERQSEANTLEVVRNADREIERIKQTLPASMELIKSYDSSTFISDSIREVYNTLFIAMAMVIIVIYLFLGNVRVTLIPAVTVPISILSSYIILNAMGYSINLLTLLALVLAISLVVDDAIVVLENIYRRVEMGDPPLLAAYRGTREVGFAVVATTAVLIAVFLPLMFLDGNLGLLFSEFAVALAAAVIFSSITALTLSPMMSSKILKKGSKEKGWFRRRFDAGFAKIERGYERGLRRTIGTPVMAFILVGLCTAGSYALFTQLGQEYVPAEDRGNFHIMVRGAEGASFESNRRNMDKVEEILLPYVDRGMITRLIIRAPGWGNSAGIAMVGTIPHGERDWSTFELMNEMRTKLNEIPDVVSFASMRSPIGGGGGRPVRFVLQGHDYNQLAEWRDIVVARASENPGLVQVDSDYRETVPQLLINIDHDRAADLGVSVGDIGRTLEAIMGERRVTTFSDRGEEYDVIIEGEREDYRSPSDINNIYVRSSNTGQLVPMSNLITVSEGATAPQLNRYNRMRSITIEANLADGYTLGQALDFLERVVAEELPEEVAFDYSGESRLYKEGGNTIYWIFLLALTVTFLVMAAQFESFIHPFVIILTVPLAIFGALVGLWLGGMTINIYSQIGIIMLIGLAAKNGILIVEFANQLRDAGMRFEDALVRAATSRLRPIMMTSLTTVMGSLPLVLAVGPGSESRSVLGMVIFCGVAFSAFMTLFVVPALYQGLAKNTGSPKLLAKRLAEYEVQFPDRRAEEVALAEANVKTAGQ